MQKKIGALTPGMMKFNLEEYHIRNIVRNLGINQLSSLKKVD